MFNIHFDFEKCASATVKKNSIIKKKSTFFVRFFCVKSQYNSVKEVLG